MCSIVSRTVVRLSVSKCAANAYTSATSASVRASGRTVMESMASSSDLVKSATLSTSPLAGHRDIVSNLGIVARTSGNLPGSQVRGSSTVFYPGRGDVIAIVDNARSDLLNGNLAERFTPGRQVLQVLGI